MNVFCVPEKSRHYYFASNGKYQDKDPITVKNFTLWANLDALDTITDPATVIVTKSRGSTAQMYRVIFNSTPPDFFEVAEEENLSIYYLPSDRFLQLESTSPCVPVPDNNWEECAFRFHTLAAFYRLNVIPSLSSSLFEREDLFDDICEKFYETYRISPPLNNALSSIFSDILFALEFFGFALPSNLSEKHSLDAARKLAVSYQILHGETTERSFAFTELSFAIERYHQECFPRRSEKHHIPPDVLDYNTYNILLSTVESVRKTLSSMNLLPDDLLTHEALISGIYQFQTKYNLPTGCCDLFTLRHIWNASQSNECDLLALCRLSGMIVKDPKPPVYMNTLEKVTVSKNMPNLQHVENIMNQVLHQVKSRSEAPQWMMNEAQRSVEYQISRIEEASKTAKDVEKMVSDIEERLSSTCQQNEESSEKFDEASQILDQILHEHMVMKKDFALVKKRIDEEKNVNKMLLCLIVLLAAVIIYKFFKYEMK
ncbi:hypothetical protein TRFO_40383 [Tritrichomonas foetus]|uniref:Uncharacterized protein n=1 Tax=Tritrichomonas foetus TaxID=1144522 RepID=A0A1J4J3M6_9EUKA|nr:hypothetical protein TRFO_40383 [Tritrichomonas foetus]|eukprot:OHS93345.1 hypothetical protein TRFO_40383 [Tritrichomonas foetus]